MLPPRVREWFRIAIRGDARHRAAWRADDVDDEIGFHLEQRVAQLVARGVAPDEARRRALAKFGSLTEARMRLEDSARRREDQVHRRERLGALRRDFQLACRALRLTPGFTTVVAITLALGIGANAAIFSLIDATLLRPLPYAAPERLVMLGDGQENVAMDVIPASYPELRDWRERAGGEFANVAAWFTQNTTLTGAGEPEMLRSARVTVDLPSVLGATMLLGRGFRPDEEERGSAPVVILSEAFWRRRFGADPAVIGRALTLNGQAHVVVGVMRSGRGALLPSDIAQGASTELWTPLRLDAEAAPRGLHFISVIARLAPGVDLARARARLAAVTAQLRRDGVPTHDAAVGITVTSLTARFADGVRHRLLLLLGAVGLVLLVACANVANLLLARAASRQRDVAIRVALGAGRARVVGQLLLESVLRALLGGALGVAIAYGAIAGLRRWLPAQLPRLDEVAVDARVLGFALALAIVTGVLFGLVPALRATRPDAGTILREGGRGTSGGIARDRVRSALVVSEVALSFVLLAGAGLLARSFHRLSTVDKGFDAERTLVGFVALPYSRYPDSTRQRAFFRALLERVGRQPGVRGVAVANELPVLGGTNGGFRVEGLTFPEEGGPVAEKRIVSPGYFGVLRARLLAGRDFDARDDAGAPPVMIVNESFARRWLGADRGGPAAAIGRRVEFRWGIEGAQTVVGVVADVREGALDQPAVPATYVVATQRPIDAANVLVRTAGDPMEAVAMLRREVQAIDRDLPVADVQTLDDVVSGSTARQRLSATLVGTFSLIALVMAAVGLYGVVSYGVTQRTRELGIRTALGARPWDVLRLVLRQALTLVATGLALGLLLALAFGRVLASQLFSVAPNDASTIAITAVVLAGVALTAALLPARRASRLDPLVALRQE